MKHYILGDTHGRNIWKQIVNKHYDENCKFVFIGDYFDSYDIDRDAQYNNFLDIITFKKENPERVELLLGNHDIHYLPFIDSISSGFSGNFKTKIQFNLKQLYDEKVLQLAYGLEQKGRKFLMTHAGVSQVWLDEVCENTLFELTDNLANDVNELFFSKPTVFNFNPSSTRDRSGTSRCQTPVWIRPTTLKYCKVKGYTHVVGHTHFNKITKFGNRIVVCDSLPYEYLEINNKRVKIRLL